MLESLLAADEPPPVRIIPGDPSSPFVIGCDHAGNRIPRALGSLGLGPADLTRHIAWDIGVATLAERLAPALGAFVALQTYSRLVIDCNRPLSAKSSIVEVSERTEIPGNQGITRAEAERRARAIFHPYHARIREEVERRERAGQPIVYVALHSFTPEFLGVKRPWHAGVLYHRDTCLAHALLELLRDEPGLVVGDNEPYSVSETSDYAILEYGERRGHLHVELEVRQDLLADADGVASWAERLARLLPLAVRAAERRRAQGAPGEAKPLR